MGGAHSKRRTPPPPAAPPKPKEPVHEVKQREIEVDGTWYREKNETSWTFDLDGKTTTTETHTRSISVEDKEVKVKQETDKGVVVTSTVRGGLTPQEAANFEEEWGLNWRPRGQELQAHKSLPYDTRKDLPAIEMSVPRTPSRSASITQEFTRKDDQHYDKRDIKIPDSLVKKDLAKESKPVDNKAKANKERKRHPSRDKGQYEFDMRKYKNEWMGGRHSGEEDREHHHKERRHRRKHRDDHYETNNH